MVVINVRRLGSWNASRSSDRLRRKADAQPRLREKFRNITQGITDPAI